MGISDLPHYPHNKNNSTHLTKMVPFKKATAKKGKAEQKKKLKKKLKIKSKTKTKTNSIMDGCMSAAAVQLYSGVVDFDKGGKLKHSKGRFRYSDNYPFRWYSNEGQQNFIVIAVAAHLNTFTAAAATPDVLHLANNLFDQNPYQKVSGGNYYGNLVPADDSIFLESMTFKFYISNMTNTPFYGWLYAFSSKRDNGLYVDAENNNIFASEGGGQGLYVQPVEGFATTLTKGYPNMYQVGMRIENLKDFTKLFEIKKKIQLLLVSGASKVINLVVKYNRRILKQELVDNASTIIKNLTCQFAILGNGVEVVDDTVVTPAAGVNELSLSPGLLGIVVSREVSCHACAETNRINVFETNPTIVTGATATKTSGIRTFANLVAETAAGLANKMEEAD